jgi:hypothetical protein
MYTGYYFSEKHIYGPQGYTRFYDSEGHIYGPSNALPWSE